MSNIFFISNDVSIFIFSFSKDNIFSYLSNIYRKTKDLKADFIFYDLFIFKKQRANTYD